MTAAPQWSDATHIHTHTKGWADGWMDGVGDPRKRKARLCLFMFVYFCRLSIFLSSFFDGGQKKKDAEEGGTKSRSKWATETCFFLFLPDGVQVEGNSSLLLLFERFSHLFSFSFSSSRFFLNIPFSSLFSVGLKEKQKAKKANEILSPSISELFLSLCLSLLSTVLPLENRVEYN